MERRLELTGKVRRIVLEELEDAPPRTAVLLSGGVDSQLIFAALCDMGKDPIAVSFTLADRESKDFKLARKTAQERRAQFVHVALPTDLGLLRTYVSWAVHFRGLRGKAAIECFWPRVAAIKMVEQLGVGALATGDGGDGYHVISKRGMIHFRDTVELMDEFREAYYAKPNWSQTESIRDYAGERGISCFMPLASRRLLDEVFLGLSWEEVNKPRQKILLREAFRLPVLPPHVNLQLGDSGIAELFQGLTPEGAKSPVAFYNEIAREADDHQERLL
jgi:asparagine synthetase B (glutamine-hydrolysing)